MCYNIESLEEIMNLENIDKIKKDLEKRKMNNKNYFWILSIFVLTVIIVFYSFETNNGIMAQQKISTELVVQNQANIHQNTAEQKIKKEKTVPKQELSNEELLKDAIVKEIIEKNIKGNNKRNGENPVDGPIDDNILINDEEQLLLAEKEILEEDTMDESENEEIKIQEQPKIQEHIEIKAQPKELPTIKATTPIPETVVENKTAIPSKTSAVFEPKTNFNTYKCYSILPAKASFIQSCEESLNEFLSANTAASRLEIIGIIDLEDVKNLSNKSDANQEQLAKSRTDNVRNYLKNKTKFSLSEHSYYLKTELPTRGFIIRAYH